MDDRKVAGWCMHTSAVLEAFSMEEVFNREWIVGFGPGRTSPYDWERSGVSGMFEILGNHFFKIGRVDVRVLIPKYRKKYRQNGF